MRISDWSSDVCSSDLVRQGIRITVRVVGRFLRQFDGALCSDERTGVRCAEAIAAPDGPVYLARLSVAAYSGKRGSPHNTADGLFGKGWVSTVRTRWAPTH